MLNVDIFSKETIKIQDVKREKKKSNIEEQIWNF
jgi:hypothetical protein